MDASQLQADDGGEGGGERGTKKTEPSKPTKGICVRGFIRQAGHADLTRANVLDWWMLLVSQTC